MRRIHFVKQRNGHPVLLCCSKQAFLEAPHRVCIIWGEYRNPDSTRLNCKFYSCADILSLVELMSIQEHMENCAGEGVVEMINKALSDIRPYETQKHVVSPRGGEETEFNGILAYKMIQVPATIIIRNLLDLHLTNIAEILSCIVKQLLFARECSLKMGGQKEE